MLALKLNTMPITEKTTYTLAGKTYEGVISFPKESKTKRPCVLIVHTFAGQKEFEVEKAEAFAQMGYVGFAIDMYGQGIRASHHDEASALMGALNNDRPELLVRIQAALAHAKTLEMVDEDQLGVIGYCFGGKCVLDLVRSGVEMRGACSFHGLYDAPGINKDKAIRTPLLVFHGWDDPLAPPADTVALGQELTRKGADWELIAYGNTGHAFTNPNANAPERGVVYNKQSNDRAWKRMCDFFEGVFT